MKFCLAILIASFIGVVAVHACKYNVRDVGFVELGQVPYKLYCLIDRNTPKEFADTFRQTAHATLLDGNVEFEILNAEGNENHPALSLAREQKLVRFPAALLVASASSSSLVGSSGSVENEDERRKTRAMPRSLLLRFDSAERSSVWPLLESVVSSPKRDELLGKIVDAFAVVLLVEGTSATENERARTAAEGAIAQITKAMDRLPKPVKFPPQLMVISRQAATRENVLLWSLSLASTSTGDPVAAVVYGRGRLLGTPLQGPLITQTEIFNYLSMIGQDCECSLDRAWMRGPVIPARWDSDLQTQVAKALGFDPESPTIKTEISQILARGPNPNARRISLDDSAPTAPLGYKEISVDEKKQPITDSVSMPRSSTPAKPVTTTSTDSQNVVAVSNFGSLPLITIVGIGTLAVGVGLFVWLRRKAE